MSEVIGDRRIFSLVEVARSIEKTIARRYTSSYWVKAELNKLNYYSHSGHAYPDLVQKQGGKVITQMRSNLWRKDFERINANFQSVLKEPLKDGIKILFLAKVKFDAFYGLSLQILDIDPAFTLGDLQKEKQETLLKLKKQGIFNQNKTLQLPLLPQRIAVISVETSNGYADFLSVVKGAAQEWNYKIFHFLFPSLLQGDAAVKSIRHQLSRIEKLKHHFDLVAIIRGGGGDVGLACYNHYNLAATVATSPLPVITGIGHSTNETVTEMVAYENAITPTKLAEMLVQKFHDFSGKLKEMEQTIVQKSERSIEEERQKLQSGTKILLSESSSVLWQNRHRLQMQIQSLRKDVNLQLVHRQTELDFLHKKIAAEVKSVFLKQQHQISILQKSVENMAPVNVLKRGYSITTINGKALTNAAAVKTGDQLETHLYRGKLISKVTSIPKTEKS